MTAVPKKEKQLRQNKLFVKGKEHVPEVMKKPNGPQPYDANTVNWKEVPDVKFSQPKEKKGSTFVGYAVKKLTLNRRHN